MKKVVFCEIAWMKNYCGVTEDDKPMNGGKYIDENGEGGEVFNFYPINHKIRGYVMHYGDELHIERFDKIIKSFDEVRDVTVVWVASDGESSKIVGWYENATMYRYWQNIYDGFMLGPGWHNYNFMANEEDCYLIPEDERTFVIPRASKAGTGCGMGQSQIWYADSSYAQNELIPKVLEYFESIKENTLICYVTKEQINACAKDEGLTSQELIDKSYKMLNEYCPYDEILSYINLAVKNDDCFETRSARADIYASGGLYNESEEDYKVAINYKEDPTVMAYMVNIEILLNHNFLAISIAEKIRKRKKECDLWPVVAQSLTLTYVDEGELDLAQGVIDECKTEDNNEAFEWIEDVENIIKEERERLKKQK